VTLTVETWCEALESGKYKQAARRLRRNDAYCCLGVACNLSGAGKWIGEAFSTASGSAIKFMPEEPQSELGLTTHKGTFLVSGLPEELRAEIADCLGRDLVYDETSLVGLNDDGVPFSLIAKVIRARPKGLFREDAP
jgi:hypothetical protein